MTQASLFPGGDEEILEPQDAITVKKKLPPIPSQYIRDTFEEHPRSLEEMMDALKKFEAQGLWLDATASSVSLVHIPGPMFLDATMLHEDVPPEAASDTVEYGSKLFLQLPDGKLRPLRKRTDAGLCSAVSQLLESGANIGNGSEAKDEDTDSEYLQRLYEIAKGGTNHKNRKIILWFAGGKITAVCTSRYEIMALDEVFTICLDALRERFDLKMTRGYNSYAQSRADFELTGQDADATIETFSRLWRGSIFYNGDDVKIGASIITSNTKNSAARVKVWFSTRTGILLPFGAEDIECRHIRSENSGGKPPLKALEEGVKLIFSQSRDSTKKMEEMAKLQVFHPIECLRNMATKVNLGVKIAADAAEELNARIAGKKCHMTDIFFILADKAYSSCQSQAETDRVEEKISKLLFLDWRDYDRIVI